MYSHSATIRKPLPDKRLITRWTTFRNQLVPGQEEEWTMHVTHPDGTPAKAQTMAVLFDKTLDQIEKNSWFSNLTSIIITCTHLAGENRIQLVLPAF